MYLFFFSNPITVHSLWYIFHGAMIITDAINYHVIVSRSIIYDFHISFLNKILLTIISVQYYYELFKC